MFSRTRHTIAATATVLGLGAVLGLGIGSTVWASTAASAAPASVPPVCTTASLVVWVNVDDGQGAAGTWYYPLEFTNISSHTCRVWGYPGVSATDANGKQLGDPAGRQNIWPGAWVNIGAGGTAHALFGYGAAEVSTSGCTPKTASYLKVYVPNQYSARHAFFDFPSCTVKGHTYLFVSVIRPGSGI